MGHETKTCERLTNWKSLLSKLVFANLHTKFEWGKFDCCLFPAKCVDAMTGKSFEAEIKRHYSDKKTAIKWLKDGGNLEGLTTSYLGEPVKADKLVRGDVALIKHGNGKSLSIYDGDYVIGASHNGLLFLPSDCVLKGWRI